MRVWVQGLLRQGCPQRHPVLLCSLQDVSAAAGQLKSLRGQCPLPSPELLTEIAAVGSGLTSLDLHPSKQRDTCAPPRQC